MTDLSELFARDPFELTRDDISEIVKALRGARHQFNAGNMKAGSTKPKTAKQKEIAGIASKMDIKLEDLL